jgi:GDP-4-dehydro-6-deoxy-D-mannose reductase
MSGENLRALVTGSRGFVGPYLLGELRQRGIEATELTPDSDICDFEVISSEIESFVDLGGEMVVFHLAALSHVGTSWREPERYLSINAGGTLNILRAIATRNVKLRFVYVSSSEVYGNHKELDKVDEKVSPMPLSPYAASKLCGETFVLQYGRAYGLDAIVARPFNHIGPNQSDNFLVAAIARRLCQAKRDGGSSIPVGNLDAVRDFLDVRDVVRAYVDLALKGEANSLYNISSGRGVMVSDLINRMIDLLGVEIKLTTDPTLVRPVEVARLVGDSSKLIRDLDFEAKFSLDETLLDVLSYWQDRL